MDTVELDQSIPVTARIWNYLLGGRDNFAADRTVGDRIIANLPQVVASARHSRAYLARTARYLAGEAGVRQFLDIGSGLPTAGNIHEVAQSVAPDARVVYADHDPMVLAHARILLTSTPEGATDYLDADLGDIDGIVGGAAETIDFSKPVALSLMGLLGHVENDADAKSIVDGYLARLAPGSYLTMYDGCDIRSRRTETARMRRSPNGVPSAAPIRAGSAPSRSKVWAKYHLRTPERFGALFAGLTLVAPGIVSVTRWRPADDTPEIDQYGAVGRKP
jgi:hypothetical protein